jgi:DnaK suppressor protein
VADIDKEKVAARLRERAQEIEERRKGVSTGENDQRDSELADYDQHPADDGTETHEQDLDETTDMLLADEADRVQLAMQRLAEGNYGKCIDCGKDIPRERLEAIPEAVRCVEDQARWEATLRSRPLPPNRGR